MINFDRIVPQLFVGTCPRSTVDVDRIRNSAGVSAVLNLQTDRDFAEYKIDWSRLEDHYRTRNVTLRRVPIIDFNAADLRSKLVSAVDTLEELLASEHTVYLHCTAGIGRAPTTAVARLALRGDWELDSAVELVMSRRRCAPNIDVIRAVMAGTS